MAVVDVESKYACGWALGSSADRELALRCWQRVRERMATLDIPLAGTLLHHDQDSVYTSYRWLQTVLLEDGMRVSYSENGAKGNPWIESLWGRLKTEIGSRISEASSLPELREVLKNRSKDSGSYPFDCGLASIFLSKQDRIMEPVSIRDSVYLVR